MIPKMADFDMFFHVCVIKEFSHPSDITPVKIPFTFPTKSK